MIGSSTQILKDAADWYYDACELYEDEDLDQDDHLEVVQRAFSSSDCDDFALVLAEMTGWQPVRLTWSDPEWGFGHHTMVRSPEGKWLDVNGWETEAALRKRYGVRGDFSVQDSDVTPQMLGDVDEDGIDDAMQRIVSVIRALPLAPFNEEWFIALTTQPVPGADIPFTEDGGPSPG